MIDGPGSCIRHTAQAVAKRSSLHGIMYVNYFFFYADINNRYMEVAKQTKECDNMKIAEARQIYSTQIKAYHERHTALFKQKKELEEKMKSEENGSITYANEAATLELSLKAVEEQKNKYQEYLDKLMQQWNAIANMEAAKQQGEAMEEIAVDMGKIMEVARRIMNGGIVPPTDEKKLMEYSMELYQAAKNIGALAKKEKEEYESLWDDEEKKAPSEDPTEIADNTEAFASGPAIVDAADTIASETD